MNIEKKIILITGSSGRVGKQIAVTLANAGAKTVIHYHSNQSAARQTAEQISKTGAEPLIISGDISRKSDWIKIRDYVLNKWGKIDVLVNNAAIFYKTPFFDISEKDWSQFMDINLKGAFLGCQIIGEAMMRNKQGKIINITDVSAQNAWKDYIPYCISKAGLETLTKGLAKALAPHVMVNAVAPGTVLLAESYDEAEENALINKTPLKRVGEAIDIANTVKFLIEGSDFINGTTIRVDGGRSIN